MSKKVTRKLTMKDKDVSAKKAGNVKGGSFTKTIDKASPVLLQACVTGKHLPEVKL